MLFHGLFLLHDERTKDAARAIPAGIRQAAREIRLPRQFSETFHGRRNAARTIGLEEGLEWAPTAFSSVDSQFLELRLAS